MSRLRYDIRRVVVEVVAVSLVLGCVAGWLWTVLAPDMVGVVGDDGSVVVALVSAGQAFPREAVLGSLCAGAGVLLAAYYGLRFRMRPVGTLLALICGGAGGTALAVLVGRLVGPGSASSQAAEAAAGDEIVMPLTVHAHGLLAAWPVAVALVVAVVAIVRDDRHPWGQVPAPRPIGATTADVS